MSKNYEYQQRDGYDRFRDRYDDGHTKLAGTASYYDDGSLKRMVVIRPTEGNRHTEEVLNRGMDGSCEYLYMENHKNH